MERLWSPWRMRYVGGEHRDEMCIFCAKPTSNDDIDNLILWRSASAFVIMNLFPYNTGHIMVVPYAHVATLEELNPGVNADVFGLLPRVTAAQQRVLRCDGFNIGLNIGSVAGAGIAEHLHVHVVPRWEGDANFMPVLANTMVLPEMLPVTYAKLRAEFELPALDGEQTPGVIPQAGAIVILPAQRKVALRRTADGTVVLPKGHVEPGEAAYQTAVREVREEMGLQAQVAGWGGTLRFSHDRQDRLVAYLIMTAASTSELDQHLGHDTLLFDPDDAVAALSHEAAQVLLQETLSRSEVLFEAAA